MEEKILKTQIYENKTVLNETSEQPIDVDFTLPEFYPDILKILKCCCEARISSKGINGTTVTGEGTATVTVIYADNENMLNSYEYQYPFSKSFEVSDLSGGACVCITAKTDYINCRAVTARKVDIHGAVSITATVTEKEPFDIISDIDLDDVEVRKETVAANRPVSCNEKVIPVEEDIEIGAGLKDINCLIRYDGTASVKETKLIAGKAMVKGELAVNILYCSDEGEIASLKENLPFSQMIEVETSGEECGIDADVKISALDIKPKSDSEGKTRSFSVISRITICVDTYCNSEIEAVLDAYSRKYETAIEKRETVFNRILETVNENFTVKQSVDFENGKISKVIDTWCKIKNITSRTENGVFEAQGSLTVNVIAVDEDGVPAFYEREIPFNYSHTAENFGDDLFAEPKITVSSSSYTLQGENGMDIRAELSVNAVIYECNRKQVLTNISVDYEKPSKRPCNCAMTIYFAQSGESVWDIASRYLADIEEIKEINEITDEILNSDKMILVPLS